ncbi:DUF202 domain-containing protein [Streptomyces pathocidini]|uniref:DUF202 domain-containing protein n=1 Tax=Streptomyces pathocidini TaxID=1650571 RepID=UPI0033F074E2
MKQPGQPAVRDPGLQPERTRLAWRRTTLACAVVAVLAGRLALYGTLYGRGSAPRIAAAVLVALALAGFLWVAHGRIRALAAPRPPVLRPGTAAAAVGCAVALAVFGVALVR